MSKIFDSISTSVKDYVAIVHGEGDKAAAFLKEQEPLIETLLAEIDNGNPASIDGISALQDAAVSVAGRTLTGLSDDARLGVVHIAFAILKAILL